MKGIYKDKLILINEAFSSKNYDTVIQESCKIFEAIMKKLYVEALGKVDSNSRRLMIEAEYGNEKANGIDSFSFRQVIELYKQCKFFNIMEKQTQRNYHIDSNHIIIEMM